MAVPDDQQIDGTRGSRPVPETRGGAERLPDGGERSRSADEFSSADAEAVLQLLSRTSQRLAESLDYEDTLLTTAEVALPYLGSWCIVDVMEADGRMRRIGIVHPDPLKKEYAKRLEGGWPPRQDDSLGLPRAIRSGTREVIPHVPDEMLVEVAGSEENLRDLRALGIGSVVVVPLIARGRILGAITFVSSDVGHQYSETDVILAESIASLCALALDNARLFTEAAVAREEAEKARKRAVQINEQLVVSSLRQQELAEEAWEANQAKSQFLANMSHEIRTPINAIIGYTDLLEVQVAGALTARQKEYVTRIQASSRHLIGLIDDILDLAKVEAGRMHLDSETLPADQSISAAIALIEPQAETAGVSVKTACPAGSVFYRGDGDRVRQILVILLSNALKFTPRSGSIRLSCGTSETPDEEAKLDGDGPWSFIRVVDTGIGISEEGVAKVFEPFVQVDQGTTGRQGGTGLGLAIGLELARRMGGNLSVRSVLGKGSCFTLWLPGAPPSETGVEE